MDLAPTRILAKATWRFFSRQTLLALQSSLLLIWQEFSLSDLYAEKKGSVFNALWALVFAFATLNILGLTFRKLDPRRTGMNFGEILAILVVLLSFVLFGLEMLGLFHIFPVKLNPR